MSQEPQVCIDEKSRIRYRCVDCGEVCNGIDSIRIHIETTHTYPAKNRPCTTIPPKPKNLIKVANFLEVGPDFNIHYEKVVQYICDECSKEFPSKNSLKVHVNNVHKKRKCSKCDLKFNTRTMKIHQHEAHGVALPTCGVCGYKSPISARIIEHQRKVHMKEKHVACDQCNLSFYDRLGLERHKISHGAERKFECSFCHKRYPRLNTLRLHEKIHKKEKNKVCSICGEGYVQKASLNYHMQKHHPGAC